MIADIPINAFVVPVVEAGLDPNGYAEFRRFRGTGFLFGPRGALMTAAHVVESPQDDLAIATPGLEGGWLVWSLQAIESHETEDVAVGLVPFGDEVPASPLRICAARQFGSAEWMVWGYPEDVMYEVVEGGTASPRPDLVFVSGYVRRRMPSGIAVPVIRGQHLYECGGLAGPGCSGAPVILSHRIGEDWPVAGVYLGERLAPDRGLFVSYAARLDDLSAWTPQTLGRSLVEESYAAAAP